MLKFFKKQQGSKQPDPVENINANINPIIENDFLYKNDNERLTQIQQTKQLALCEDEGLFDIDDFPIREQSHLSKTLLEVLNDKSALSYYVQFMESRNALSFVRCWLDIENFQSAISHFEEPKKSTKERVEHDSLSVSDCDSLTADSSSLNDFSHGLSSMTILDRDKKVESPSSCFQDLNLNSDSNKYLQEFTEDALGIFKKYIALEAPEFINVGEEIRNEIIENICTTDKLLTPSCFERAQNYVFELMDKEYFDAFVQSDFFCKHQIDVLTSGNVVLEDILYNETALFYFMDFLEQEQENNRYLLEFWLAATNFHQQLRDQKEFLDRIEAQNDAVILYDKYFSLQALCPLGFSDKVRFAVEQYICGENGLMHDCFQLPLRIIERVLDKHYLSAFLASQLFYKYLSELINTVQSTGYCIYDRNRLFSNGTDCSSERSFSTTNGTFLAMEVPKRRSEKATSADMHIDTRELYDPDALWRRRKHHRLSFGRVTGLGQFVTDFEPEPDKKNGSSKIRNVMKRFVNLEEDKKKEELAWQVAEMIVKSITSVTLSENEQQEQQKL